MSVNFQRQFRRYPTAGNKIAADGAPMSTRVPLDLMYAVNNYSYTMPFFGFVYSSELDAAIIPSVNRLQCNPNVAAASGEFFIGQLPTVLPKRNLARFCWTMGMYLERTGTHATTLTRLTCYIAPAAYKAYVGNGASTYPYHGIIMDAAFDANQIKPPYKASSIYPAYPLPIENSYKLFSGAFGTTGAIVQFDQPTHPNSELVSVNLIFTYTISVDDLTNNLNLAFVSAADVSWWVAPE